MSRFFSQRYNELIPYTPGEQPRDMQYVKLNTNESPFPPAPQVISAASAEAGRVQLYSDPECIDLREQMAAHFGVDRDEVVMVNGSDEILNFAFMAFADEQRPLAFADITYGFYPVFARLNRIPFTELPLRDDFTLDPADYIGRNETIVIANPNAPTGCGIGLGELERIVASNPNNVVIVDEAYVDFGGESAVPLIHKYDNLLICGTFSKSRSLAGARLGYGIGNRALIADINTIRYSTNPYNVNRMTSAAGIAALQADDYYKANCRTIMATRSRTAAQLRSLGFEVLPSQTNFLFAASPDIEGEQLYLQLKQRGVLIRHFTLPRIANYNRITIGTDEQMQILIDRISEILKEQK